jgi:selenocysteine-specific elongation factor
MVHRNIISPALLAICIAVLSLGASDAFTTQSIQSRAAIANTANNNNGCFDGTMSTTALSVIGKKKNGPKEDLSYLEVRDLTRDEMLEINKRNEEVMNRELQAMTGISVLFSIPILYLCWVAFFSE